MYRLRSLIWIAYLVIGVIIAANHNYFDHLNGLDSIVSMIFEVLLWPLIILGVDITLR